MAISNAVGTERAAKVVGYELEKGNFQESTPNLPMRIAVFGQANTDKQGGLVTDPREVTSAQEVGDIYGYGSQLHMMMRIIRNRLGDVTGGIPTVIYPQVEATSAEAAERTITVTGTATGTTLHYIEIGGRRSIDGVSYAITVVTGDTPTIVAGKIANAINNALSAPVAAVAALGVVTIETKWKGVDAEELSLEVDVDDDPVGLSYAIASTQVAAGDSLTEINASLGLFNENWNTIVVNPYASNVAAFEVFNGAPSSPSTGRYSSIVFKPFVCLTGSKLDDLATIQALTNNDQLTIAYCPCPNSEGFTFEAAANVCALLARQAQDTPHTDVSGKSYPDMPIPKDGVIGNFSDYNNRDAFVKEGFSTVILVNGTYQIEDFVTTYAPVGENPPQFRYVRSLIQDWNVRFALLLLEQIHVVDHVIVEDDVPVSVNTVIKPKQWKALLVGVMFPDLASRAIITDVGFSDESLQVGTGTTNPDRFETFFQYKRSAFVRIASTTGQV